MNFISFSREQVQKFFTEFGVTVDKYNEMRNKSEFTDPDLKAIVIARQDVRKAAAAAPAE